MGDQNAIVSRELLVRLLTAAGGQLTDRANDARFAPLIDLASELEVHALRCAGRERALCFLLALLLEDMRDNVLGAIPWDSAVGAMRQKLLDAIGPMLRDLAGELRLTEQNESHWLPIFDTLGKLVDLYLAGLAELNNAPKGA